ncbi:ABC-three component system protein [Actinokineospora sp.]|uniref:ABC-three component system protein n=1 Tax=Actinokineospora sp. TaxID=1872133 RepID=UPI004037DA39
MTTEEQQVGGHAAFSDIPLPADSAPSVALDGPPVPPVGRIRLYSPDEWEEFIREWATAVEEDYVQIKLLGGAGDRGTDIVGFKSDRQFEGPWDCFQAKHYERPLSFSVAAAEMLKVFVSVIEGAYSLPDTYQFLAPKGLSTRFNMLISNPTTLRESFLALLVEGEPQVKKLNGDTLDAVRKLAAGTDFARFRSVEVLDALSTHSRTRWHAARFATSLPARGDSEAPPDEYTSGEARFLQQLLAVYAERHPDEITTLGSVAGVPKVSRHLQQQRVRFFRAESLKEAYSRGRSGTGPAC